MKKYIFIGGVLIVAIACCLALCFMPKVRFDDIRYGTVKFIYGDTKIEATVSDKHLKQVIDIFENKRLRADSPSCGFDENISINIDGKTFCVACDTCGIIYLLEKDRYFYLNDEENQLLRGLLDEYGFRFPCI